MRLPSLAELRERTKDEKTAIAGSVALGIVVLLFLAWLFYFFHAIATSPAPNFQAANPLNNNNGLQNAEQQFQQAYASTTQFINVEGSEQLAPISTTTNP